ncbi:MAG: hypothetical protein H6718_35005 [Polyangiaceae bacterium]|nr:hypothetical protein [Myxococcales bacterium]MCB9590669.1 hypothetical protein [Polyangiaceae bacterium]
MRFRFDAYGLYHLVVERHGDTWRVLQIGADGKRMERQDLAIPPDYASAREIGEFLDVLLHESSRPGRSLRLLNEGD